MNHSTLLDMHGRVVAVTGAGRGIGRSIATAVAAAGGGLAVGSRTLDELEDLAAELREQGADCLPIHLDVTDVSSIEQFIDTAVRHFGRLDGLVNNAGGGSTYSSFDFTEEDFDWSMHLNLKSVFYASRTAARAMVDAGNGGRIVNISSIGGLGGMSGRAAYTAVKAGVNNMTRSLAAEWAQYSICVNAVAPGMVATPIVAKSLSGDRPDLRSLIDAIPLGRMLEPDEVAPLVLFLLADAGAMITGQVIAVDGGQSAMLPGQIRPPSSAQAQTTKRAGTAQPERPER